MIGGARTLRRRIRRYDLGGRTLSGKTRGVRLALRCIAALLATSASVLAQDSASKRPHVPSGHTPAPQRLLRVLDLYDAETEEPVADAEVKDKFTGATARSTRTGNVGLVAPDFVRAGTSATVVVVRKLGYDSLSVFVDLTDSTRLAIGLTRSAATRLPTVVTTALSPHMTEFERNVKAANGVITPEEFRAKWYGHGFSITEVLARHGMTGPHIRGKLSCTPKIVIKDAPGNFASTPDADVFQAAELWIDEAIPEEYQTKGRNLCAVVVLYTREDRVRTP